MNRERWFDELGEPFWPLFGILLVVVIGYLDYVTGPELIFTLFYLIPIYLVTLRTTRRIGMFLAALSAITWFIAGLGSGRTYSSSWIFVWNTLVLFAFFMSTAFLTSELKERIVIEENLARVDYLTGAVNFRYFHDILDAEIVRFARYRRPFTLVYLDLDNFKSVNDTYGHAVGDMILHAFVSSARETLRQSDIIFRLGGDEFAILLPETDQDAARAVMNRFCKEVTADMKVNHWFISFSAGVVTCLSTPPSSATLINLADTMMYKVKHDTKNGVRFAVYQEPEKSVKK